MRTIDRPCILPRKSPPRRGNVRSALTLIEVIASTLIVAVMTVAALNTLGATARSSESAGHRAVALGLADDLLAEILQAAYREPDDAPQFGPETGEHDGTRNAFDDVDDYHNWDQSPPTERDGSALADRGAWRRRVAVTHVLPGDPAQATASNDDQGVKRVEVSVEHDGTELVRLVAYRTDVP